MKLKRSHERVVRTCISMPPALFDYAHQAAKQEGFATFSHFVQYIFRERAKVEPPKANPI